jgi:uncharacterized RDD family membrane protein YckC
MVIPDWQAAKPPKIDFVPANLPSLQGERLARPLDRLAAVIVDVFVLLVPLFILLSAPLQRALDASKLLGLIPQWKAQVILLALLGFLLLIIYQTVMHYFFSATVGKMLFDLRVRPMFTNDRLTFAGLLGRSVVWMIESVCFGLPWLAVFSNTKRRPWHDRVYDTVVVCRTGAYVAAPGRWERGVVRGFFGACIAFILMIGYFSLNTYFEALRSETFGVAMVNHQSGQCEVVDRYLDEDGQDTEHQRLQMALSLFSAGLADPACIDSELEREVGHQAEVAPITYLAQAFVNSEDNEVYNSYLTQVCQEDSDSNECVMSKVATAWSSEDWPAVQELLVNSKAGTPYLDIWAVRFFVKQARYPEALSRLDALTDHHELAEFTTVQRVKALFNSFHVPEADAALAQALSTLPHEDGEDVSSWLCAKELQNGCAARTKLACQRIQNDGKIGEVDFTRTEQALAKVMTLECDGQSSVDYLTFSESVKDADWQIFFRANYKRQKNDSQAAFRLFADLMDSDSASDLLRVEALRRALAFADHQQLAVVAKLWQRIENKEAWNRAGNMLFERLKEKGESDQALRVARELLNAEALSPQSLAQLTDMVPNESQARTPASAQPAQLQQLLNSRAAEDDAAEPQ